MNKSQNTLENKARFFGQYWGQKIHRCINTAYVYFVDGRYSDAKTDYLELTSLSQISDEDLIEIGKIIDWFPLKEDGTPDITKEYISDLKAHFINQAWEWDYYSIKIGLQVGLFLISRGYYVGDGTEIEYGWVKLKEGVNI